jgi:hypothetical protein
MCRSGALVPAIRYYSSLSAGFSIIPTPVEFSFSPFFAVIQQLRGILCYPAAIKLKTRKQAFKTQ